MAAAGAAALGLSALAGIAGTQAAGASVSGRTPLAGSALLAAARQHPAGAVPRSSQVDFQLVLKLRDAAGAAALVKAVSSPGSASYRHYLTAAQWEARFSPSAAEVATARRWLASAGFRVGAVSPDRITVSASGTAARVEKAFGTGLGMYKVHGHVLRLATKTMSLPASVSRVATGALGINQTYATTAAVNSAAVAKAIAAKTAHNYPPAPGAFVVSTQCAKYYGAVIRKLTPKFGHGYGATAPEAVCGYKPGHLRSAYKVGTSSTGRGVTVAVIDAYDSATIRSDSTRYFAQNDPGNPFSQATFKQDDAFPFTDQTECEASGWLDEQAIDVQSVHAMAPHAHILYVGARNCVDGLFNSEQMVVDHHLASIVTNSWGDDAGDLLDDAATQAAWNDIFEMADATGISVLFSSGDNGDSFNLFGLSSADFPPSSPYVTAVGGTTLSIGKNGQQTEQTGWATGRSFKCTANVVNALCTKSQLNTWLPVTYDGGSGGFTSYHYKQPFYQKGVVPAALATRNASVTGTNLMRVEPDISLEADAGTGFLIGLHETFMNGKVMYGETRYGGTSLASPLLAGVLADTNQVAGKAVGFINPAIYKLHANAAAIQDIVPVSHQDTFRVDNAFSYIPGAKGVIDSLREDTYEGLITYCDGTGSCKEETNTLSTAKGYDSMTGLGSIGPSFTQYLAKG